MEQKINADLTLTPDPPNFHIQLKSDKHYVVHFVNPKAFGDEFVMLHKGDNNFTRRKDEETNCYFFDDDQLRRIMTGIEPKPKTKTKAKTETKPDEQIRAEAKQPAGTVSPCTGPIIIPPRKVQDNG